MAPFESPTLVCSPKFKSFSGRIGEVGPFNFVELVLFAMVPMRSRALPCSELLCGAERFMFGLQLLMFTCDVWDQRRASWISAAFEIDCVSLPMHVKRRRR